MLERREPAAQEAGAGGAGGWGGLPCSVRRGSAGKSFPEDAGQWRERKRRRQLHNIWQRRGPPGPRGSRAGGGSGQRDASCHPSAARCAPRSPRPRTPTLPPRRDVPNTCFQLSPSSRRSQDPAVPAAPRGHAAPSPLASPSSDGLPGSRGPAWGDAQCVSANGARSPPWHCGALAQTKPGRPAAPAPAEQGRGCRTTPSLPALPTPSLLPRIPLDADCPGQGAAHCAAPANSWVRLNCKTGLAAGRENSLSLQK